MGVIIFEIVDRDGRKIRLTLDRWNHIITRHSELSAEIEVIKQTVATPSFQVQDLMDEHLYYNHTFIKTKGIYLIVAIKYLNGEGFIITALTSKHRKK